MVALVSVNKSLGVTLIMFLCFYIIFLPIYCNFLLSHSRLKLKALNPLQSKLQELYNTVRDFADNRGRLLALPFAKLPAKNVSSSCWFL